MQLKLPTPAVSFKPLLTIRVLNIVTVETDRYCSDHSGDLLWTNN